jgi:hypothetical protein
MHEEEGLKFIRRKLSQSKTTVMSFIYISIVMVCLYTDVCHRLRLHVDLEP